MSYSTTFLACVTHVDGNNVTVKSLRHGNTHLIECRAVSPDTTCKVGETVMVTVQNDLESETTTKSLERSERFLTAECYIDDRRQVMMRMNNGLYVPLDQDCPLELIQNIQLQPAVL